MKSHVTDTVRIKAKQNRPYGAEGQLKRAASASIRLTGPGVNPPTVLRQL